MNAVYAGVALFLGEALMIGAEIWAARYFGEHASPVRVFSTAFFISVGACLLLVYGYTYGYQAFKNIWIVTAISISGILVVEPIMAWALFRELPTVGAGIAFVLAVIGIFFALFVK